MGDPAWAADARFADVDGRRAAHDELDASIGAWTAGLDRREVFERCQAEGVPCGMVLGEADLLADPHLAARGFFRRNGSPSLGEHTFCGHLWRWDGPPLRWGPINEMGADNAYVYREVLGLGDDEWAALEAERHLSLDYLDADGNPL
jgi:crotonobetainyl-CoA:carnitine CoA-transferase CaiB-like acyl-CoA transferase